MEEELKHLGLFEGIGGFSLAARWMGWKTVAWCEWDVFAQKILRYHFPEAKGYGDIRKTNFKKYANKIDILTGGFPCQPYSLAGKRKGKDDERHLWPEMRRAIRTIQPVVVVGENVGGLISWSGGLVFEEVHADLEAEGYEVWAFILPACAKDAPHRRDRVWFIAYSHSAHESRRAFEIQSKAKKKRVQKWQSIQQPGEPGNAYAAAADTNLKQQLNMGGLQSEQAFTSHSELGNSGRIGDASDTGSFGWIQRNKNAKATNVTQNIPDWGRFPTQSPLCSRNDGLSSGLDGITFPKWRAESIKAGGNAIVPQIALEIFKSIREIFYPGKLTQ